MVAVEHLAGEERPAAAERRVQTKVRLPPLLWLVAGLLVVCQAVACVVGANPSLSGKVDLRAFYAAGATIRSGHGAQLYDYEYERMVQNAKVAPRANALPFLYPAFAAMPFVPLSLLTYRTAFFTLFGINLCLLLWSALLLRPWLQSFRTAGFLALPALYAGLFGVSVALMQGQISFVLLLVYCSAWRSLRKDQLFQAGLLMAIGMAKFQIAVPILLLFVLWRQWKVVAGFLAGTTVLAAISLAIVGKAGAVLYWQSMAGMTRQTAINAAAAKVHYGMFPVDMPNLHGLTFGLSHGAGWGLALNIVLCCLVLGFAARQRASLLVALPAAMLVSYHMQPHDLTLLLLPLSFLVDDLLRRKQQRRAGDPVHAGVPRIALLCSLLLLTLPLAAVVMAFGMNYLVSLSVAAVMFSAARLRRSARRGEQGQRLKACEFRPDDLTEQVA